MTNDNFCSYLQNRLIQTGQTGGQQYSGTSPFSVPCINHPQPATRKWSQTTDPSFQINKNFVVTAAHCLKGYAVDIWSITVGEQNRGLTEPHEKTISAEDVKIHDGFEVKTRAGAPSLC
jgi:hypothetical protein